MNSMAYKNCGTYGRGSRAFTITEVLVVMAIVGILFAMLVPSLKNAREAARRTVCIAHLKQVGSATFSYAFNHNDWGPQVMRRAGSRAPRSLLSRSGEYVNLGLLIPAELEEQHNVLYCPSQEEFAYNADTRWLPDATVAGSYAYAVHLAAEESPMLSRVRHLALISDDFTGRLGSKYGVGEYSHKTGYNVLYTDGSASWYKDLDGKIAARSVFWDDETDDIDYDTLYANEEVASAGSYGDDLDIFRVWWAFCYNKPVEFPELIP